MVFKSSTPYIANSVPNLKTGKNIWAIWNYESFFRIFAVPFGKMLEWLKRHAWKACVPQKGIASSNLALSA